MLKLFLNCSYFLIFPNSRLVVRNNFKKVQKNTCLLLFHPALCEKLPENINTASANVTSLCIHVHLNLCTRLNKVLKFVLSKFQPGDCS